MAQQQVEQQDVEQRDVDRKDIGKLVEWRGNSDRTPGRTPTTRPAPRWNLFARELEDILKARGIRLAQICSHTTVNPAKVMRLRESLSQQQPKRLPLLPPEEVDEIARTFALTHDERVRLQVSVLTTAMERVLVNRLDPRNALLAAEQLFPEIERALRAHEGEDYGIGLCTESADGDCAYGGDSQRAMP